MGSNSGDARDLFPEGEALQKAVRWLSEQRKKDPSAKLAKLIDEASLRFDLSPADAEFLLRNFKA